jgi:hypothetical protein
MNPTRTEKPFDGLESKDRAQEEIYQEIRGLTHQEQIEYYERSTRTGPLAHWWEKVRLASAKRPLPARRRKSGK